MAGWDELRDEVKRQARDAFALAADQVLSETKDAAPFRTGELRDSIQLSGIAESGDVFTCEIASDVEWAAYTDLGTRPHLIWGSPYLAWDDVVINASRTPVHHPGTEGTHWFGADDPTVLGERLHNALLEQGYDE